MSNTQKIDDEPLPMLQGKFPEIRKMTKQQKDAEIEAWRNLWSFTPSEVKGYTGRPATHTSYVNYSLLAHSPTALVAHYILSA